MAVIITLDENKCVGCNKCIAKCPVEGANFAYLKDGKNKVKTNPDACILCGQCVDVCDHGARDYRDDTETFFVDLAKGHPISIIAAPSIRFNFDEYKKLFGYLKSLGCNLFYDVSVGADIATWSYLRVIERDDIDSTLAQACPAIVSYVEKHCPELIDRLAPTQSPVLCTAIYLRKYRGVTDKLAFLSPCIAKTQEIEDTGHKVAYNVTYKKLKDHIEKHGVNLDKYPEVNFDDISCGLGVVFSRPGGLKEYVEYCTNNEAWVRQVDGIDKAYEYIRKYANRIEGKKPLPFIVDILNCSHGCNLGTGTRKDSSVDDIDMLTDWLKHEKLQEKEEIRSGQKIYTPFEYFDKTLKLADFERTYKNKLTPSKVREYTESEFDEVFKKLYKFDEASRNVNCFACGYGSCKEFAKAILNNDNHAGNCINYNRAVAKVEHEEVLQQKLRAEAATKAKSDFLANMSHEIRTPLNSVLGMTQLLLDTDLTQEQKTWANIIDKSGAGLLGLVNDILDLTKIEADHLSLENAPFNLCETVANVTDTLLLDTCEKGLELIVTFDKNVSPYLIGDAGRFKQILYNLVGNAIKFTTHGHVLIRIKETPNEKDSNDLTLTINVEDTGIGIPEEKLDYIFEKFTQAEESTTRHFGGTGLGLAIAQKLIRLMGGNLAVTSQKGMGSTFTYDLHLRKDTTRTQEAPSGTIDLKGKRALVIDDYLISNKILKNYLDDLGMETTQATATQEALQKTLKASVDNSSYDFIVLDNKVSENTGLLLCRELRASSAIKPSPIIILLSSHAYVPPAEELSASGIDGLIVKPFLPEQLASTLKHILESTQKGIKKTIIARPTGEDAEERVPPAEAPQTFESFRVLVAEDMPFNRLLMTKMLGKFGCVVDTAVNGIQTVEKVKRNDYDLVFMDCQMPEMDGYEATRKIREHEKGTDRNTPIVALTADAMTTDRERCLEAGMNDHIGKPFKQEQILAMIERWNRNKTP